MGREQGIDVPLKAPANFMQLNRYSVSCAALTGSSSQARVEKNSSLAIDSALSLHEMSCSLCFLGKQLRQNR
jgi:hypothetical protein